MTKVCLFGYFYAKNSKRATHIELCDFSHFIFTKLQFAYDYLNYQILYLYEHEIMAF